MAYKMTFSTLEDDVRRYLERGFTEASDPVVYEQIPRLITLAERRIARDLKIQGFLRPVQTTLLVGNAIYDKPDRWRDTVSMSVNNQPLLPRSYEYLRTYWPNPASTGTPLYYADYDYSHWIIAPTPSAASTLEILYYEMPQLLDEDNQTNWLTDYAPSLLLYAALLEATPFLKKDERIPVWQSMYENAAKSLNAEDLAKITDRNTSRTDV